MSALDDLNKKNWREMSTLEYLIYITHDSIGIKAACATELADLRSEIERLKADELARLMEEPTNERIMKDVYEENELLKAENERLKAELDKWENWKPDAEDLREMQEQASSKSATYNNGRAAQHIYIGGLEAEIRRLKAERTWQSIETAPKDETFVEIYSPAQGGFVYIAQWRSVIYIVGGSREKYWVVYGTYNDEQGGEQTIDDATLWRPLNLPQPPEEE